MSAMSFLTWDFFSHIFKFVSLCASALEIVVCEREDLPECTLEALQSHLQQLGVDSTGLSSPRPVQVPSHAPAIRAQFEEAKLAWPVNFHEDKMYVILGPFPPMIFFFLFLCQWFSILLS